MSGACLGVRIGSERYAVPVEHVLEVMPAVGVTPVPGAPPEVLGVCNVRGQIIPVLQLATALRLSESVAARIVIVEHDARRAGLAVDDVIDVAPLPEPTEPTESSLLLGAAFEGGELVGVLDVGRVMDASAASSVVG